MKRRRRSEDLSALAASRARDRHRPGDHVGIAGSGSQIPRLACSTRFGHALQQNNQVRDHRLRAHRLRRYGRE